MGFMDAIGGGSGLGMGLMGIGAIAPTLFGTGGGVSVPSAMARPGDPTSKFVDDSGMLRDQFRTADLSNEFLDAGGGLLGNLRQRATAQGPSQQAQYLQGAAQNQAMTARDQMGRDAMSNRATSEANMAMKGGLGTGARERMARGMNTQQMMGQQNINRNLSNQNINILANDESQKLGLLRELPGQYQSFGNNLMSRQIGDRQGGMNLLMDKYGRDMQAYAANQMARSQAQAANAGGKGLLGGLFG